MASLARFSTVLSLVRTVSLFKVVERPTVRTGPTKGSMPGATVVKQIVFDGIVTLILGVVVAFMYRSPARV